MEPVRFRWLGVAGIELRLGARVLAIDPFFTRPPLRRAVFGRVDPDRDLIAETMAGCNDVLITHAHWDHVMDVPEVVRNTGAVAWGSANACQLLAVCGVPQRQAREIRAGDRLELGPFRVEVMRARHRSVPGFQPGALASDLEPPLRVRDYRMDVCFSILVGVEGLRLLNWRSVRAEPAPRANVLFVDPHGGRCTYQTLIQRVQPQLVIPVHWDDFFRPLRGPIRPGWRAPRWVFPPVERVDLDKFSRMIGRIDPQVHVLVPEVLRDYDVGDVCS
jgi:hypothetical protein